MEAEEIGALIFAVVGFFSAITTAIPNASNNKGVQYALKLLNVLGMNFGKNKNA